MILLLSHTRMTKPTPTPTIPSLSILIIGLTLILSAQCFQQLHEQYKIMQYYEEHSSKPILHIFYNRHFRNSSQFREFQHTLDELYANTGDYLDILMTDCDKDVEGKLSSCQAMRRTKDNRQMTGTVPSSQFRKLGAKLIQNPPTTQILDQKRDVYSYDELKNFMASLIPNFYRELNNKEQYEQFLLPHYSPKLIAFIRDDEDMPQVMKQIGVANFLKIDLAYITDLNEELVSLFTVKKYPSFAIVTYNFEEQKNQYHYYQGTQITQEEYHKIQQFVSKYALSDPRNDLLFHKIVMEEKSEIMTVQTKGQLEEFKERASGWVIIAHSSDGKIPQKMIDFHGKYGRYFSYVNYVHEGPVKFEIYNPTENFTFPLQDQLQFNSLDSEDFKSNMTVWLSKGMLVLGATQKYAHICGLAEKTLFRGHVRCLVISKQGEEQLKKFMKIDFEVGFIVRTENPDSNQPNKETKGLKFLTDDYATTYKQLDYATRMSLKDELDRYLKSPVSQVRRQGPLQQVCFHPLKRCLFLVTNLAKNDRTLQVYLKQIAFDFMNSFTIYEMDIDSNPQFVKAIGGIRDKKADIVIYNPRQQEYMKLNKKVTKGLILQFMKASLKDDKRLKRQNAEELGKIVIHRKNKSQATPKVQPKQVLASQPEAEVVEQL